MTSAVTGQRTDEHGHDGAAGARGGSGIFVTGTDTEVGKTVASCALLHGLTRAGLRAVGMKPVASGSEETSDGLRNEDALALQRCGVAAPYEVVNPFAYEPPIAPHLAADAAGRAISLDRIERCYRELAAQADVVVVEGAGGWRVPMDRELTLAEIPRRLELGVVLVVGIRLGCINHALLTQEAIRADGLPLLGWVANCIEPVDVNNEDQIQTLEQRVDAPLLGVLPHRPGADPASLATELDVRPLLVHRPAEVQR